MFSIIRIINSIHAMHNASHQNKAGTVGLIGW